MSLLYRQEIQSSDLGVILNIVQSSGFFSTAEVEMACELATDRLENGQQSSYQFLFAENDGEVVGYTCYGLIPATAASYDLYWIAVSETSRGKKMGKILLQKTEEIIRGMGGTLPDQPDAVRCTRGRVCSRYGAWWRVRTRASRSRESR